MTLTISQRTAIRLRPLHLMVALAIVLACGPVHAQLLIGQTAGCSGPVAAGVKETSEGARLYIDKVNQAGGVAGQRIELVALDDKFAPKLASKNARVLIEDKKVLALFLTRGTPHTEAIIPVLNKHSVPLVDPSTGAMVLHTSLQKHVLNVRSTYQREAEKAVLQLSTIGVQRIVAVHADEVFPSERSVAVCHGGRGGGTGQRAQPGAIARHAGGLCRSQGAVLWTCRSLAPMAAFADKGWRP